MRYVNRNGQVYAYDTTEAAQRALMEQALAAGAVEIDAPVLPLNDVRAQQKARITDAARHAIATITAGYPQFEIDTWQDQEAEARAWLASQKPAPTLQLIADARGLAMTELAARVIAKADAYRPAVAAVIGTRQALEDAIDAAPDAAAVLAIVWP